MPKNTTIEKPATVADDIVQISAKELEALRAAASKALDTAVASVSPDVQTGEAIATAFAKTFAPMVSQFSTNMKLATERVVETSGRTLAQMIADDPKISAYNPRGDRDYPRQTFFKDGNGKPRRVFFCGTEQSSHIDRMTHEEIAAYDAFTEDCACRNGTWQALIKHNGSSEELHIILPSGDRDKMIGLPSGLTTILYELRNQGKKLPDATTLLNKMLATATDPDAFIANLDRLLKQSEPATV